ncbi:MAG: SMI1/KNR4 family protein, partial [Bradymonadaceae bacterium]
QARAFAERYGRELFRNKMVLFWSVAFPVGFYLLTITVFLDGNTIPFADNPWDVAPSATISEALETVWEPIRDRLAGAVPWLFARTVAVALLEGEDGELRMTYLFLRERDRYVLEDRGLEGRVPTAVAPNELHRWVGVATLDTLVAAPPSSATETQLEDGRSFPLPLALRELHRRHGCIDSGISSIGDGLGSLQKFFADNPDPIRDVNDGAHPRRFVEFGSDGTGNAFVFDLDRLDSRGDPLVAFWDHESRRVGERHPFWVYVDRRLRTMLGIDRS